MFRELLQFWNLLSTWLFLLTNMINLITTADSISRILLTIKLHTHVIFMNDNLHDYFSFDMYFVSNYINNQLIYYFITDVISAADQAEFQQFMKDCKNFLQLLEWDNASNDEASEEIFIILINKNNDSDCFVLSSDYRNIKINLSDIFKLTYNSTIIQYNNWLADLKIDFDENSARFSTSCQKIILILITLNK